MKNINDMEKCIVTDAEDLREDPTEQNMLDFMEELETSELSKAAQEDILDSKTIDEIVQKCLEYADKRDKT